MHAVACGWEQCERQISHALIKMRASHADGSSVKDKFHTP
jgi:hypothetical protein